MLPAGYLPFLQLSASQQGETVLCIGILLPVSMKLLHNLNRSITPAGKYHIVGAA